MRYKAMLGGSVALIFFSALWWVVVGWYEGILLDEQRLQVHQELEPLGNALTLEINRRLLHIEGLKNFVLAHTQHEGGVSDDEFKIFASGMLAVSPGIRVLHLSPGGVNRFVYPLEGNEGVLGHDLLHDKRPHVQHDVERTIQTGRIALSDPYELHQGGLGLVARLAIQREKQFWGLAVVVLDVPPILTMAGLDGQGSSLTMALRDRNQRVFFGSETVFSSNPVLSSIVLPEGTWELAALPAGGWSAAILRQLRLFQGVSFFVVVLLSMLVILIINRQQFLRKGIAERTRELEEELGLRQEKEKEIIASEARYRQLFLVNPQPMWVYDLETLTFLAVNNAAVAHYGYSEDEFLRMTIKDIRPPEEVPRLLERVSQGRVGYSDSGGWRHRTKDGRIIEVEIISHALLFNNHRAKMVLVHDVTTQKLAEAELKRAHQRLLAVMNSLEALVYIADMQTYELLFINEYGRKAWGDVEGQLCWESLQKDQEGPCSFCTNKRLLTKEGTATGVIQWEFQNTANGRWYDCRDKAIPWTDGRLVRLEIATDITERKQASEEIKRRAEEMTVVHAMGRKINQSLSLGETSVAAIEGILEAGRPHAAFLFLRDGDNLLLQGKGPNAALQLWGDIEQHCIGKCLCGLAVTEKRSIFSLDIHADERCIFKECKRAGYRSLAALPLFSGDEVIGVISMASATERHFEGQADFLEALAGLIASGLKNTLLYEQARRDYVTLKEAGNALRESEQHSRYLANSGLALIWTSGTDKLCDSFNQQWLDFTGRSLDQELGNGWTEGVHPEDFNRWAEIYTTHFDQRKAFALEYRLRHHDGSYHWIIDYGNPRYDTTGGFLGYIGFCYDITERKRVEEEREQLQSQLLQAQKMESVGRLAGGVAHDFNNMLSVIIGYAQLMLDTLEADDPNHEYVEQILDAGQRSAATARQLLAFARKQTIRPEILDLNETVEGMLKMLRRLIGEDIDLTWLPGSALHRVKMDPSQIDQILANLCVNSRYAIADTGKITIETGNVTFDAAYCQQHMGFIPGDYVLLAVSDDGCGMDRETVAHVFEPFFTTKEVGTGTGLGLAMVYGIIKQNKGFVNVYSELGYGTRIAVYFPRYDGRIQDSGERGEVVASVAEGGRETILLVEDELAILNMVVVMLEQRGYTVLTASSPEEALQRAASFPGHIDLLMTDVVMPGMNGRDLAKHLLGLYPNLKCLFMSGYTANVIAHHGVLDPDIDFIQKPFSMKDLAAKIRTALV